MERKFSRSMRRGRCRLSFGSASVVAAATTTTAARLVLRFIHLQRTTAEVAAVQRLHRLLRVGVRHFDESESTRLTGVAIVDQGNLLDAAVLGKQCTDGVFGGGEGQISNIEFHDESQ